MGDNHRVSDILIEVSGKDLISEPQKLAGDLGMDSLDMVLLAMKLEEAFGIKFPDDYSGAEDMTVGELISYINSLVEEP